MSEYAKCNCQRCGQGIEFPVAGDGQDVTCPHCGRETTLIVPQLHVRRLICSTDVIKQAIVTAASRFGITAFVIASLVVSTIFILRDLKEKDEALDCIGKAAAEGYGNMAKAMEDSKRAAALATAELDREMAELAKPHEMSIKEKTDEAIKAIDENARWERELADAKLATAKADIRLREARGEITREQAAKLTADLEIKRLRNQLLGPEK